MFRADAVLDMFLSYFFLLLIIQISHMSADKVIEFDFEEAFKRLVRYLLEGLSVGIAVQVIASRKINLHEVILVGVTSASLLSLFDSFSPTISSGARSGMGLGLGLGTVGYKGFAPFPV